MDIAAVAETPTVERARSVLRDTDQETVRAMIELTEIPAPPFAEATRGAAVASRFRQLGLADVTTDDAGNVLARVPHAGDGGDPILVVAHLDTVFPADTDVRVRVDGERLRAPGISDNSRGLAAMLALARALRAAELQPQRPLVLAASVGEEGIGDLRGVKHLFRRGSAWRQAAAFVALDGAGSRRVITQGVGSRRFRVRLHGPGGHSWADWGRANPVHALGAAIGELSRVPLPRTPRTTLTVARIGGGSSVNAIPEEAWLEVDLRSERSSMLEELEQRLRDSVQAALRRVNAERRRGTAALRLEIERIGDRPGGETPPDSPIVQAARGATHYFGETPELASSSTDANVPMSLGIPSITIGAGGEAGGTHTLEEWYVNSAGARGVERALVTVLALAGVAAG